MDAQGDKARFRRMRTVEQDIIVMESGDQRFWVRGEDSAILNHHCTCARAKSS